MGVGGWRAVVATRAFTALSAILSAANSKAAMSIVAPRVVASVCDTAMASSFPKVFKSVTERRRWPGGMVRGGEACWGGGGCAVGRDSGVGGGSSSMTDAAGAVAG